MNKFSLKKYHQEHLLYFYNELTKNEQKELISDLKNIDYKFMHALYKNSYFDEVIDINKISSLKIIDNISDTDKIKYHEIGENLIKNNQYGIVLMAGGSASRLGLGIPKGLLKLKIHDKEISLFEIYLNELLEVNKKYNININLYIMTSKTNNEEIKKFFYDNNYFNYNSDNIKFFTQDELPILDIQGNLLLKSKNHVLFGPNGNGNVFNSLKNNGLLKDMYEKNIKYLLFSTIDNVLAKLVDLEFIGATICNNYELSSKTITKKDELEKDWIFCKYNNKPFMLPSRYITKDITNELDGKGNFIYREKNITYHLISIDLVNQFANINLKYHRAYKKNNYIDVNGKMVNSLEPNTFKFEQFIFDAFYYAPDMLLYRIKKDEFCPIKTKDDITKVQEFFEKNGK